MCQLRFSTQSKYRHRILFALRIAVSFSQVCPQMQFLTAISLLIPEDLNYWGALHARFTHADGRGKVGAFSAMILVVEWFGQGIDKATN